ncbi:hypothetical protein [Streptomyces sp. NPDC047000]|uniref:hypothetical protein n=1 Tax=Streptomyces sp. NPDC047000 TaxID=3155474 RepID=UPI0033FF5324
MNAPASQPHDESAAPSGRLLALRTGGAAVTGAALTWSAVQLVEGAYRYDAHVCAKETSLCLTPWPVLSFPAAFALALVVLVAAYRLLGIRPGAAVIPPTLLLAPLPIAAARRIAGTGPATVAGAVWAAALVLALWRPYRTLGLSTAGTLLLVSTVMLMNS